jgi:hypothetical protein
MSRNAPLPTVFGRLSTILTEHEHLSKTLGQVSEMCSAIDVGRDPSSLGLDPRSLLGALRAELSRHFEAEESPAHFGTVADERPDLLAEIVELKTEHRSMLETVKHLTLMAEDRARWSELPPPALGLVERLRAHERAEAELVQGFIRGQRQS